MQKSNDRLVPSSFSPAGALSRCDAFAGGRGETVLFSSECVPNRTRRVRVGNRKTAGFIFEARIFAVKDDAKRVHWVVGGKPIAEGADCLQNFFFSHGSARGDLNDGVAQRKSAADRTPTAAAAECLFRCEGGLRVFQSLVDLLKALFQARFFLSQGVSQVDVSP